MRRLLTTAVVSLVTAFAAFALDNRIQDIDINVLLNKDGSARIVERWRMYAGQGTEMYLVRKNLGDIRILNLEVRDETGRNFINEGEWDTSRTMAQKAGRCGLIHKTDGVEICWGLGNYGDHTFSVSYLMKNAIKSMDDSDCFHIQLVSDGLSAPPEHVKVRISSSEGTPLTTENSQAWGFGFNGRCDYLDGGVTYESTEPFVYNSSVISLIRFDKGLFNPSSKLEGQFQNKLDKAMKGAEFAGDEESLVDKILNVLIFFLSLGFIIFPLAFSENGFIRKRIERKKALGTKDLESISWSRDIPFDGDLEASDYVLKKIGEDRKSNALASALILRMIYKGELSVGRDAKGKIQISFNDNKLSDEEDATARGLYEMMVKASGSDRVLQDKEFSRWSKRNTTTVRNWFNGIEGKGKGTLTSKGWRNSSGKYTLEGQQKARGLIGFKKYLTDFTLTSERASAEVSLWQDYLVFGALLGVAEQVAKELKDINPQVFEETMIYDYTTLSDVLRTTRSLGNAITTASAPPATSSGRGGFGGSTSFGGGGGFSGGGHGGGVR